MNWTMVESKEVFHTDYATGGQRRHLNEAERHSFIGEKPSPACQLSQDLLAFAVTVDTH
jgi:hypothetical protein